MRFLDRIEVKRIILIADAIKGTCAVAGGYSLVQDHKPIAVITFATVIICELISRLAQNFKKRRNKGM